MTAIQIKKQLQQMTRSVHNVTPLFYKTGPGEYAEHDQFIGIPVPHLRKLAKHYRTLPLIELKMLMESPINEERLLALLILVDQYHQKNSLLKENIYQFYLEHLQYVNNWNLVDASAHWIIGAHTFQTDKTILFTLAQSDILWERRIAIVATWYFIRQHALHDTIQIAQILLHDSHDLIHKAVGWMLREVGKKDEAILLNFLNQHAHHMPRMMLRYAIEKLPESIRKMYLLHAKKSNH